MHDSQIGRNVSSYVEAFAKCEIEWIREGGMSTKAQNHVGAHHAPESHIRSLHKWLALTPAILPTHDVLRQPVLSHPDLSAANILVTGENADLAVSGIIDWQGASIGPMFGLLPPPFLQAEPEDVRQLDIHGHMQNPSDGAGAPSATRTAADSSGQEVVARSYLTALYERSPELYDTLSSPHLEKLKAGIYYSAHSWSDGLPLLDNALLDICDSYGKDIPSHSDHPECPASFTEEERTSVGVDLKFHHQQEVLERVLTEHLGKRGMAWREDGDIPSHQFDDAQKALAELYAKATKGLASEPRSMDAFNRAWPCRKGRISLTSEVCT